MPNSEGDPAGVHASEAAAAAPGAEPGPGGWRHPQQGSHLRDGHRAAGPGGAGAISTHNRFEALTEVHEEPDDVFREGCDARGAEGVETGVDGQESQSKKPAFLLNNWEPHYLPQRGRHATPLQQMQEGGILLCRLPEGGLALPQARMPGAGEGYEARRK